MTGRNGPRRPQKPQPQRQPESQPESGPKSDPGSEPESGPKSDPGSEPEAGPEPGPQRRPRSEPRPRPQPRPRPPLPPRYLPRQARQSKQPARTAEAAPGRPAAQPAPRRVAVSAPRRHRTGGYSARAGAADLHAQPQLGQLYVRSLVRNQLRLALGVLAVLAAVFGGLPAAFATVPGLRTAEVFGIRLPWLLLGVVAYPLLVGAAYFHVRHAERVERDFTDLLGVPDALTPPEPPSATR